LDLNDILNKCLLFLDKRKSKLKFFESKMPLVEHSFSRTIIHIHRIIGNPVLIGFYTDHEDKLKNHYYYTTTGDNQNDGNDFKAGVLGITTFLSNVFNSPRLPSTYE